jgi:hypothetical protein
VKDANLKSKTPLRSSSPFSSFPRNDARPIDQLVIMLPFIPLCISSRPVQRNASQELDPRFRSRSLPPFVCPWTPLRVRYCVWERFRSRFRILAPNNDHDLFRPTKRPASRSIIPIRRYAILFSLFQRTLDDLINEQTNHPIHTHTWVL